MSKAVYRQLIAFSKEEIADLDKDDVRSVKSGPAK